MLCLKTSSITILLDENEESFLISLILASNLELQATANVLREFVVYFVKSCTLYKAEHI